MKKIWVTYGLAIGLLVFASWWILQQGRLLENNTDSLAGLPKSDHSAWQSINEG